MSEKNLEPQAFDNKRKLRIVSNFAYYLRQIRKKAMAGANDKQN